MSRTAASPLHARRHARIRSAAGLVFLAIPAAYTPPVRHAFLPSACRAAPCPALPRPAPPRPAPPRPLCCTHIAFGACAVDALRRFRAIDPKQDADARAMQQQEALGRMRALVEELAGALGHGHMLVQGVTRYYGQLAKLAAH